MKIGIDARWIFPELSGVGVFTQELIRHLARADRENEYFLFFHRRAMLDRVAEETRFHTAPNMAVRLLSYGPFSPRSQIQLPGLLADMHLDVFHSPNYMIPFRAFPRRRPGRLRCVVTVHDLIPLLFPHYAPRALKTRFYPLFKRIMTEVGARADVITTVSECSRRDIISKLGIPERRARNVRVIPNGVSPRYQPPAENVKDGRTVLYVGRWDPYKNLPLLIEAFARLRGERGVDATLRVIGPPDARYPEPRQAARRLGVDAHVEWRGYLSGEELLDAYQRAAVLVLPSRYEGFGLPVVEAMACGTPVICSNASSLPEVAGDAALYVDPDDVAGLVSLMARVLTEPVLARDLGARGLKQARLFTWTHTADLMRDAFRQAVQDPFARC